MRPSPQFSRFLGTSWTLLSEEPVELAPTDDPPPFPSRMLSITPLPRELDAEETLGVLQALVEPRRWDGELHGGLAGRDGRCAVMLVNGNPLTGHLLFVARLFMEGGAQVLLIFETSAPEHIAQYKATVEEIDALSWPLIVDDGRDSPARDPASAMSAAMRSSLAPLLSALRGDMREEADKALSEPDLLKRYIALSAVFGRAVTLPPFVEALDADSGRLLLRTAEGICLTLSMIEREDLQHYAASLLARVLIVHPGPDSDRLVRAATLSAHVVERTRGVHGGRWEEAMLSHLFARASLALRHGHEDYGDMDAITGELQRNDHGAVRVLQRLAEASSLAGLRRQPDMQTLRLVCCDLAMSLVQRMNLDSTSSQMRPEDAGAPVEPEFAFFAPATPDGDGPPANFFGPFVSAFRGGLDELAAFYGVDVDAEHEAGVAAVQNMFPDERERPHLLFLRSFRSSKRIWLDNKFSFDSRWMLPYPEEPTRLSLEAALVKGLRPYACSAIGGLQDPLGMARIATLMLDRDSWKEVFFTSLQYVELVIVLPDETESLAWELDQLAERDALGRVLLIMVPRTADARAESAWEHGRTMLALHGADLPAYDAAGGFVQLGADGRERERWPFEGLMDGRLIDALMARRR